MNTLQCDIIKKGTVGLLLFFVFCAVQPLFTALPKETHKVFIAAAIADENKENKENENKPETEGLAAADYTESDFMPRTSGSSYVWDIFKLLIILGLMVGGFYYFFRYISKKTGINARGGDIMRTVAVLPIGQNKHIQVVDLAGKLLVIGVADNGINLITEITDKDNIDRIRFMDSYDDKASGGSSTFQDFLKKRIGRGIGKVAGKIYERRPSGTRTYEYIDDSGNDIEYIKNQHGRLKKL
ncbi:MAG: flagellar biosynthetic protein FliO [Leptospirales bacterium]|nr:flagellar biosynthetic protein FliO [Leptospirales bacterium]